MDKVNLATVRQSFAQTVFTHQVHEAAANRKRQQAFYLRLLNLVFVGIALIMLIFQVKNLQDPLFAYIAIGAAVAEILFIFIQLSFNFEQEEKLHKNSALKYMALRDRYRMLIADIMSESLSKKETQFCRDALQDEYQSISDLSPTAKKKDYKRAQKELFGAVKEGEQFTWTNTQINRFLLKELRLGKK